MDTKLSTNKDILNLVKSINPSESILFADKILKFNDFKIKQERYLVITGTMILSIKNKKLLRRKI